MRSFLILILAATPALSQELIAKTDPKSPADELKSFKVPAGFEVQLVAAEPDIEKPIQIAWDSSHRLWITTTRHYPIPAEKGKASDKVFILSDFDPSGKAKKIETFYDKLNIPIGILPLPDGKSCLVSEVGRILKLTDTTGSGKADKVEELFTGFGTEDTHGMTNSFLYMPDGWVYATHGFKNTSKVKAKDGSEITMNSGNTYRFKPDGSRIEIFTRGQVNPFGLCCDPYLNLYSADCHSKPITQLIRGATYQSFGKPHDGLGFAPHVTNHSHGSTGLCGLEWYSDTKFPKEYRDCLYLGNVVTNRINSDRITFKGSTPVAEELPDFLTSSDPWFRPTDIKLGMDGALYFADFYNRIIGHYEVDLKHPQRDKDRGRIWRIVYTGKAETRVKPGEPGASATGVVDLKKAKHEQLAKMLYQSNLTTKLLTFHELVLRCKAEPKLITEGGLAVDALDEASTFTGDGWGAHLRERVSSPDLKMYGGSLALQKLMNPEREQKLTGTVVRSFASRSQWKDADREFAVDMFEGFSKSPWFHRAIIDGITLHPHADFVQPLLKFLPTIPAEDTYLKHATRIALRDCLELDMKRTQWPSVKNEDKLTVPEQIAKSGMIYSIVDSGLGCKGEHVLEGLVEYVKNNRVIKTLQPDVYGRVGRYGTEDQRYELARPWQLLPADNAKCGLHLVRGMQAAGWKPKDDGPSKMILSRLIDTAASVIEAPQSDNNTEAVPEALADGRNLYLELHRMAPVPVKMADPQVFFQRMQDVAGGTARRSKFVSLEQKLAALEIIIVCGPPESRGAFTRMLQNQDVAYDVRERLLILVVQNKPSVSECTLARDTIKTAKYATAVQLAAGLAGDPFGADLLLLAVKNGEAPARLLQEKVVLDKLKATGVRDLDAKVKELTAGIPSAEKRLDDLIKKRAAAFPKAKTDAVKGKAVFAKNCAACHTLENVGAKVGPQLDGVGVRGLERLLEDTLDPNRNVDAAFRATKFDLLDGKTVVGLLLREEGAVYVVSDPTGKEIRIPKADVDKKTVIQQSAMPSNVDSLVPEKDYFDLLAYLLQQKPK